MTFPEDTKVGDYFLLNGEPVLVTAWNYSTNDNDKLFDIEFIDWSAIGMKGVTTCSMGYDLYMCDIIRMPSLLMELF